MEIEAKEYVCENDYTDLENNVCFDLEYSNVTIPLKDNMVAIADRVTPKDTETLFELSYDASNDIENALSDGLCNLSHKGCKLHEIFRVGIMEHLKNVMIDNLESIVYNNLMNMFTKQYGDNEYTEVQEENINDLLENISYNADEDRTMKSFQDEFAEGMKEI